MAWNLHITGPAQKEFRKLPAKDQARVKDAVPTMNQDSLSGDIKRLETAVERAQVDARDLELINQAAHDLNAEIEDILRYQGPAA